MSSVTEGLEQDRQIETRNKAFELEAFGAEPFIELQEVALVVIGRKDAARAGVRHESHQEVVVRRSGPGGVSPAALQLAELAHRFRARFDKCIVAAAVENDKKVIISRHRSLRIHLMIRFCGLCNGSKGLTGGGD